MDKKTAFKILGLDAAVSFEEAKKAYRTLAKKYHPDLSGENPSPEGDTEAKMKDINLAFRYLTPFLRTNKSTKKTEEPTKETKEKTDREPIKNNSKKYEKDVAPSFLLKMSRVIAALFNKRNEPQVFKNKLKKETSPEKSPGNSKGKNENFEDVLRKVHTKASTRPEKRHSPEKKRNVTKSSPYSRYQKYMTLKRKMKSGRPGRHKDMSIGKVDKIDPIKPVRPVRKS